MLKQKYTHLKQGSHHREVDFCIWFQRKGASCVHVLTTGLSTPETHSVNVQFLTSKILLQDSFF